MPVIDLDLIARQVAEPRAVALWRGLKSLTCCTSFMNTGAHPDDETSAMLAALAYRDGIAISFACANRGEGGQNNIGSHTTLDLGVIRTAEMERAADVLGLRLYWLSESPDDTIFDFGFSKSGIETLGKWGHQRALERFVNIVRLERPDIICPTFLDIPGQHGHHRAMTQLAHEVFTAAADASYADSALPTWQVKKLYLPAWSGAGDAYDDDLPPPPATLIVHAKGEESITGWTWEQIGQQSRRFHLTQGMGRWVSPGDERDWPLHLAQSVFDGKDESLTTNLPTSLASLADFCDAQGIKTTLIKADTAIQHAIDAFPQLDAVRQAASSALKLIRLARAQCPTHAQNEVDHRLKRKETQLAHVIRLSARVRASTWLETNQLHSGDSVSVHIESDQGDAETLDCHLQLPPGWKQHEKQIRITDKATPQSSYPSSYLPGEPAAPALQLSLNVDGEQSCTSIPLATSPLLRPPHSAQLSPPGVVLNTNATLPPIEIKIAELYPADAQTKLILPSAWSNTKSETGYQIEVPTDVSPGLYNIELMINDQPTNTVTRFDFPHIEQRMRIHPARTQVRVLNVNVPPIRVGYVGGGNDRVVEQLASMGFDVHSLSDKHMASASELDKLDTLVIGLFAIRTRPVLQQVMPKIHQWIKDGGNLLTLYHRPWDNWNENTVPPKMLRIGKPSLRWRVTNENATVTYILPDHPLLNSPNVIDESDWLDWHKERGLYFAAAWDPAYEALLSMSDPEEEPHTGALLSAKVGAGRHTHTSLILHHQMEKLVPGAYRLMANLVSGDR